jgi:hypothetical protein
LGILTSQGETSEAKRKFGGKKTWDKYILGSLTSQTKRDFGETPSQGETSETKRDFGKFDSRRKISLYIGIELQ